MRHHIAQTTKYFVCEVVSGEGEHKNRIWIYKLIIRRKGNPFMSEDFMVQSQSTMARDAIQLQLT